MKETKVSNGHSAGGNATYVDDRVDSERLTNTDRLSKDHTVGVPELNTVDLLRKHDTASVNQLSALDRVGKQRRPARFRFQLSVKVDLIVDDLQVRLDVVVWCATIDLDQCFLRIFTSVLGHVPDWRLGRKDQEDQHSRWQNDQ